MHHVQTVPWAHPKILASGYNKPFHRAVTVWHEDQHLPPTNFAMNNLTNYTSVPNMLSKNGSRLNTETTIRFEIWGFISGTAEDSCHLGCDTAQLGGLFWCSEGTMILENNGNYPLNNCHLWTFRFMGTGGKSKNMLSKLVLTWQTAAINKHVWSIQSRTHCCILLCDKRTTT